MQAGRLDRLIELRHRVLDDDPESRQKVEAWPTAYASVWAQKVDVRGREYLAAKQVNADLTTTFRIRHRTDVVTTDRIVYNGTQYSIQSIAEIGRLEGLEIMATSIPP